MSAQLSITKGKGFHLTFENGITISIQIGPGNYCDNYNLDYSSFLEDRSSLKPSSTVEIAVWDSENNWLENVAGQGDTVGGYLPVEEAFRFAELLRSLPSDLTSKEIELAVAPFDWPRDEAA